MATTRFKGESGSDRLGVSTISDSDMIQVRHKPGTIDDADKGVSKAVLNSCPFGVSSTAAATAAKTAALTDSNPDFTLISGREVVVCFSAANSASSPTLNFAGSGAYPMYYPDGTAIGNWDAGTWMHLKYFEATINDTLTQRWIALSPVVTNAITSGDKRPAASGAVASAIGSIKRIYQSTYNSFADLQNAVAGFEGLRVDCVNISGGSDPNAPITTWEYYWWNVITIGVGSRLTQIACQAYIGYASTSSLYVRSFHDTQWSAWVQK